MRYIKKFERSYVRNVWVIPIKMPDFEISLRKIGMSEHDISSWLQLNKNNLFTSYGKYPNRETISIQKETDSESGFTWFEEPITKSGGALIFMGKIEITPEEIKDYYNKIEIQKNSKKFNI